MTIIERAKKLNLPLGEYVVVGSGVMEIHGIRPANDIDIAATKKLFEKLKQTGDWELTISSGGNRDKLINNNEAEIRPDFKYNSYTTEVEDLIRDADIIEGIPFMKLDELLKWKKAAMREKDLKDIELIEEYLMKRHS